MCRGGIQSKCTLRVGSYCCVREKAIRVIAIHWMDTGSYYVFILNFSGTHICKLVVMQNQAPSNLCDKMSVRCNLAGSVSPPAFV